MVKATLFKNHIAYRSSVKYNRLLILFVCFIVVHKGTAKVQIHYRHILKVKAWSTDSVLGKRSRASRKGKFLFYWGYNRASYSKSNIYLKGNGYKFNIADVKAHDEQTPFSSVYIDPTKLTWPQYNYGLGYYIDNNTFILVSQDHMKYRMIKQTAYLTGYINNDNNNGRNIGVYNNAEVLVGEDGYNKSQPIAGEGSLKSGFVSNFENCDGLNNITVEIGRMLHLWATKNSKFYIDAMGTFGGGMEIVDTKAEILGYASTHNYGNKKTYHLAGYGCSASMGMEFGFFTNFLLQARLKGGYINLPNINTTIEGGKASQHFTFIESMIVIGYSFVIGKKN